MPEQLQLIETPEKLLLPRKDKHGNGYLSYSSISLWNDIKGFNTGRLGKEEFIRSYFFGEEHGDAMGWAAFGSAVEDYICKRESADRFTDEEKKILETIEPLGLYQHEIKIPFENFYLKGFVDDQTKDRKKVRDYKTASANSAKKYYTPAYKQLAVYSLATYKELGFIPEAEVCIIERAGNPFRGEPLSVKENVWYVPRTVTVEELQELEQYIITTAKEISQAYKVYKMLNV